MGCFDIVYALCPACDKGRIEFQSKGGDCCLAVYSLAECPIDVLFDVNRHSPMNCPECGAAYRIGIVSIARLERVG